MKKIVMIIVCTFICVSIVQTQNSGSMSSMKVRQTAAINGSAAKGNQAELETTLTSGLNDGLTRSEFDTTFLLVTRYATSEEGVKAYSV